MSADVETAAVMSIQQRFALPGVSASTAAARIVAVEPGPVDARRCDTRWPGW
jgi:hypothetical protein